MIYLEKPNDFRPKLEVAGCFAECKWTMLLLLRQDHKSEPNTYGMPAGKVEYGEGLREAMVRELREETGIGLSREDFVFIREVYVRYDSHDIVFHMFRTEFEDFPKVTVNPEEHKSYVWLTPADALRQSLMQDEDECIKLHYGI